MSKNISELELKRRMRQAAASAGHEFRFRNKSASSGEIMIYGFIGEDYYDGDAMSATRFRAELKALGNVRTIDLRIDSEGGSVFDARSMYTALTQHKATVNVFIDGLAASAASFLAMAGDKIAIAEGGFFMIHNARGITAGTAEDHDRTATLLRTVDETIAQTYIARTGQSAKTIRDWMTAETWFDGNQTVEAGFAGELMENKRIAACAYPDAFRNLPEPLRPKNVRAREAKERAKRILAHVRQAA